MVKSDVTVLIPTFKRPERLSDCVDSVLDGELAPKEIIIVYRSKDVETLQKINSISEKYGRKKIKRNSVVKPGHIPPIEKGIECCETDIICVLDDDTVAKKCWLKELVRPLENDRVGVVGGPAVAPGQKEKMESSNDAGRLRFYGQIGGGLMWLTEGDVREVVTVPEGNSAWRTSLLRGIEIPDYLREGNSRWYGLHLTMSVLERGKKVLFNPHAFVYHYPGAKGKKNRKNDQKHKVWLSCRNYSLIAMEKMEAWRSLLCLLYFSFIGSKRRVGLLSAVYMLLSGNENWKNIGACMKGRMDAVYKYMDIE